MQFPVAAASLPGVVGVCVLCGEIAKAGARVLAMLVVAGSPHVAWAAAGEVVPVQIERESSGGRTAHARRPVAVRFHALGRHFELTLEPNDALLADGLQAFVVDDSGRREIAAPAPWIGYGHDGSEARLSIRGDVARGYVRTSSGTFVIEPDSSPSAPSGAHRVRRAEDVLAESDPVACAAAHAAGAPTAHAPADMDHSASLTGDVVSPTAEGASPAAAGATLGGDVASLGSDAASLRVLDVSIVADAEYYRHHGEDSVRDIVELVNAVDGIYRQQLGVMLQIVQLVVYRSADAQPFVATTDYGLLLSALSLARNSDPERTLGAGSVTHLLTGLTLNQGVKGVAWMGGVCDPMYGVGLSSVDASSAYLATIMVAHEIGHNLGAWHDGSIGSGCEDVPEGFVMSPLLRRDLVDEFSNCSRARILDELSSASCVGGPAPELCGNGTLEMGEECDASAPGDQGCCRYDCRFHAAGLPCGESGQECLDAVCNGNGECAMVANNAACTGDDACTLGQCSGGACVPTAVARQFDEATANFRLDGEGTVSSAKVSASSTIDALGSDPCGGGVTIRAVMGDQTAWEEFVPGTSWVRKGSGKFFYRATTLAPGRVKSAKIQLDVTSGRATFRIGLGRPMLGMVPNPPSIFVLAGDRIDGQCATSLLANCSLRGSSYRCE